MRSLDQWKEAADPKANWTDVGGAYLTPEMRLPNGEVTPRQYVFKKEETPTFKWMYE